MQLSDVLAFIRAADESDLYAIRAAAEDRINGSNESNFAAALVAALHKAASYDELDDSVGNVARVVFETMEGDNGFFFFENAGVRYADGREQRVNLSVDDAFCEALTEMSATGRSQLGSLGSESTLTATFAGGEATIQFD